MKQIIEGVNGKLRDATNLNQWKDSLTVLPTNNGANCSCIRKENCPRNETCRAKNIIYKATIKSDEQKQIWIHRANI